MRKKYKWKKYVYAKQILHGYTLQSSASQTQLCLQITRDVADMLSVGQQV